MAVRRELQGQGLGGVILADALIRAWKASEQVASWAVVVDAKEGVREFYGRHGFTEIVGQPGRMFVPMKMIERRYE
jgi:predicted GNAT family N-acyltransferase